MAYASTVSGPSISTIAGKKHYRWTITETEAGQANDFVLTGAPAVGTIKLYRSVLTAGTGTTINPRIGRTNNFALTGNDWIGTNSVTAALINDASDLRYTGLTSGKIYCRSYPSNAATDHSISTEVEVIEGLF